jgi:hypothetical protein
MSGINFATGPGRPQDGAAQYIEADGSFDFDKGLSSSVGYAIGSEGVTSLLVGTLQIEIDVEYRTALHVWGYHPREAWMLGQAVPPQYRDGIVMISAPTKLIPGVSLGVAEIGEWTTTFDARSGWVAVRADPGQENDQTILIASGTLLGFIGESLNSIWIKPVFL